MKTCTTCHQALPLTEFHRMRNAKDGLQSACKVCKKQHSSRAWQKRKAVEYAPALPTCFTGPYEGVSGGLLIAGYVR